MIKTRGYISLPIVFSLNYILPDLWKSPFGVPVALEYQECIKPQAMPHFFTLNSVIITSIALVLQFPTDVLKGSDLLLPIGSRPLIPPGQNSLSNFSHPSSKVVGTGMEISISPEEFMAKPFVA